jgi:hypothetical protein
MSRYRGIAGVLRSSLRPVDFAAGARGVARIDAMTTPAALASMRGPLFRV